jgi:phage repressor protein C with HTH and peptisase S24 domain
MNHIETFKEFKKYHNISQQDLADRLKISKSTIRNIEAGNQKIPLELAEKIEQEYNVNARWLLFGKGEMLLDQKINEKDNKNIDCVLLPVRDFNFRWLGAGATPDGTYAINAELLFCLGMSRNYSEIIFAHGDSMEPTIYSGDALLIDTIRKEIIDGVIYCIKLKGETSIKRLQKIADDKIILISENSKYSVREREISLKDNEFEVIGQVQWIGRVIK